MKKVRFDNFEGLVYDHLVATQLNAVMKSSQGENSIGGVTTQCHGCNRNGLIQSPEMQLHAGRKWIKIGKLHSQNAILKREQEWQKNWSFLVQYSAGALDELNSEDNHEAVSSEHNSR